MIFLQKLLSLHHKSRKLKFLQNVPLLLLQELGLLLLLVAVAILTYSSLVYFAERGQKDVGKRISTEKKTKKRNLLKKREKKREECDM